MEDPNGFHPPEPASRGDGYGVNWSEGPSIAGTAFNPRRNVSFVEATAFRNWDSIAIRSAWESEPGI
jgi:hypothetical protein